MSLPSPDDQCSTDYCGHSLGVEHGRTVLNHNGASYYSYKCFKCPCRVMVLRHDPPQQAWRPAMAPNGRLCGCLHCQEFRAFDHANPEVYREFVRLFRQAQSRGFKTWSINAAFEVYRWQRPDTSHEEFKLNNNARSRYARVILMNEPSLRGFLRLRRLKTAGCIADEIFEAVAGPIVEGGNDPEADE